MHLVNKILKLLYHEIHLNANESFTCKQSRGGVVCPCYLLRKGMVIAITNKNTTTRFRPIFSLRIAGYLMTLGFPLLDMRDNEKYTGRKVYYFVESLQLNDAIQDYLNNR